ncbi:MAG: RNA signal recognition particle [Halobacteriovorax sp.]|nr:RNA signal recognition particle [Halobacteriovorax sp.]|tara:strand:+ start:188331 stop:188687 length:357 start_codon:yes stop_codon:yes gene_type:complete
MSNYVDSFLIPVPKENLGKYEEMARLSATVWKELGALDYFECMADDAPVGEVTSFPRSVDLKDGEIVIFAVVTYKDRAHRDEVNEKAFKDPRLAEMMDPTNLPFDGKRMIWGGFKKFI